MMIYEFAPIPTEVLRCPNLTGNDKVVLAALLRRAGKNGHCWPSHKTLGGDCGMSVDQIRYAVSHLIECKLIRTQRRVGGSNSYTFNATAIYGVRESFPEGVGNSQGVGNSSRVKESIKEDPTATHLVLVSKHRKPPAKECSLCRGTGWKDAQRNGISAVTRCSH